MRKSLFLLASIIFICFSCSNDDFFEENDVVNTSIFKTRSASIAADPLSQLDGIPVHIKSVYNGKYLSATPKSTEVVLHHEDDNSLRQRWYLTPYSYSGVSGLEIVLAGGNSSSNTSVIINGTFNGKYGPILGDYYFPFKGAFRPGLSPIDNVDYYHFKVMKEGGNTNLFPSDTDKCFVRPADYNSNTLIVDDNVNKGELNLWEVIPIDEFRILDITYDVTTGDEILVTPKEIVKRTLVNDTNEPMTRTLTFQETVSDESSFSNTEKLATTIRTDASAKFSIATFVEGSLSTSVTSSKEWAYTVGGREVKTKTITESVTHVIPPRTSVTAKLIATEYNASLTYIIKLSGINTGKIIYLKGKWKGIVVQETRIEFYNPNGLLIRTINVDPK